MNCISILSRIEDGLIYTHTHIHFMYTHIHAYTNTDIHAYRSILYVGYQSKGVGEVYTYGRRRSVLHSPWPPLTGNL